MLHNNIAILIAVFEYEIEFYLCELTASSEVTIRFPSKGIRYIHKHLFEYV